MPRTDKEAVKAKQLGMAQGRQGGEGLAKVHGSLRVWRTASCNQQFMVSCFPY